MLAEQIEEDSRKLITVELESIIHGNLGKEK